MRAPLRLALAWTLALAAACGDDPLPASPPEEAAVGLEGQGEPAPEAAPQPEAPGEPEGRGDPAPPAPAAPPDDPAPDDPPPAAPLDPAPEQDPDAPGTVTGLPCDVTTLAITCPHQTTTLFTNWSGLAPRQVHWQLPQGEPPAAGWPVALLFQGSVVTAELFWVGVWGAPAGGDNQAWLVKELLDRGYAVLTPEAHLGGFSAWDTNVPPFSWLWQTSTDHRFVVEILAGIADGLFGPLDPSRLYASGISSGGYMTSRMAVSYPGRFRALVIHAGSYATCAGAACLVPGLPDDHPPTRFLHGGLDPVVPAWTMRAYARALEDQGTEVDRIEDPWRLHVWLDEAPTATADWFDAHP